MYIDAGSIAVGFVGVVMVAAFSTYADRDEDGSLTLGRWINLEGLFGLHWKTGDRVSRWATRFGWVLIAIAAFVQIVRVSQAEN